MKQNNEWCFFGVLSVINDVEYAQIIKITNRLLPCHDLGKPVFTPTSEFGQGTEAAGECNFYPPFRVWVKKLNDHIDVYDHQGHFIGSRSLEDISAVFV